MNLNSIFGKVKSTATKVGQSLSMPSSINGKRVVSGVVPFGPAVSKAPGVIKGFSNVIKRATTNPFAGVTVKQGLKNIGGKAFGLGISGAATGTAYGISKSLASGEPASIKTIFKGAGYGVSAGLSLPGAVFGEIAGLGQKTVRVGTDLVKKLPTSNMNNPTTPTWNLNPYDKLPNIDIPHFPEKITMEGLPTNIQMPAAAPVNISLPSSSFSPSVSAGGGIGDILPLLLLMGAGAGVVGYAVGKRKKKKKYKKRKRH